MRTCDDGVLYLSDGWFGDVEVEGVIDGVEGWVLILLLFHVSIFFYYKSLTIVGVVGFTMFFVRFQLNVTV
jgi:hypothetical protein